MHIKIVKRLVSLAVNLKCMLAKLNYKNALILTHIPQIKAFINGPIQLAFCEKLATTWHYLHYTLQN